MWHISKEFLSQRFHTVKDRNSHSQWNHIITMSETLCDVIEGHHCPLKAEKPACLAQILSIDICVLLPNDLKF